MNRPRAYSLPELLVACALFTLVLGIAFFSLSLMGRARKGVEGRLDPRRDIRTFFDFLATNLRCGAYLFPPPGPGRNLVTRNHEYKDLPGNGQAGSELFFAVPAQSSPDPNAYTLYGIYPEARTPADPENPDAMKLVLEVVDGNASIPGMPASISFAPGDARIRSRYDPFLVGSGSGKPKIFSLASGGAGVRVSLTLQRQIARGPNLTETYDTLVYMRNR